MFIYLFILERREGREKKEHQCVVASRVSPTGDLAHNPDLCPEKESNQRSLARRPALNPLKPHQPGQYCVISIVRLLKLVKLLEHLLLEPNKKFRFPEVSTPHAGSSVQVFWFTGPAEIPGHSQACESRHLRSYQLSLHTWRRK